MSRPRKNLAESVLARAELFRRGMLFGGVPKYEPDVEMPAPPAGAQAQGGPGVPLAAGPGQPGAEEAPAVPGAGNALADGSVNNKTALQTLMPAQQQ